MKKFYVFWGSGSLAETKEFSDQDEMIECVRLHERQFDRLPTVYYGEKIEFEPAEIVKSWKIRAKVDR